MADAAWFQRARIATMMNPRHASRMAKTVAKRVLDLMSSQKMDTGEGR